MGKRREKLTVTKDLSGRGEEKGGGDGELHLESSLRILEFELL